MPLARRRGRRRRRRSPRKTPATLRHRPPRDARGDRRARHRRRARRRRAAAGTRHRADGAPIYAARCAGCHGKTGKEGPNDVLVGRLPGDAFPFAKDPRAPKTIGSYWPYATTVFDYIRRAMPPDKPGLADATTRSTASSRTCSSLNELIPPDAVDRRGVAAEGEDAGARSLRAGHAQGSDPPQKTIELHPTCTRGRRSGSGSDLRSTSRVTGAVSPSPNARNFRR